MFPFGELLHEVEPFGRDSQVNPHARRFPGPVLRLRHGVSVPPTGTDESARARGSVQAMPAAADQAALIAARGLLLSAGYRVIRPGCYDEESVAFAARQGAREVLAALGGVFREEWRVTAIPADGGERIHLAPIAGTWWREIAERFCEVAERRRFVGIELDPTHCQTARRRITAAALKATPEAEQGELFAA